MIALDTNILVRFLTGDNVTQAHKVYQLFKQTEIERTELYIPILVVIELVWVLDSIYKFERPSLIKMLENLTLMPIFKFENLSAVQSVVQKAKVTNFDLSDLLIAYSVRTSRIESILTFDKKAAKHKLFELL
ncbi:MAG: type II toxin-antitoxin system VapC family toxin [Candidatus Thiodubiliella endoseptemdiera]|uniref:Type II toxin-antitoxin system VapC family toxin n=1 Tax=Candidatus Thiodubiliella endoseptemdiera TaxID=2738886 RepID=A0A853F2S9_9GAMM|nr:type II toxin-antitoxin system VapC family toxin [Candidatus Thiodubiliella endoseptemdiera]